MLGERLYSPRKSHVGLPMSTTSEKSAVKELNIDVYLLKYESASIDYRLPDLLI